MPTFFVSHNILLQIINGRTDLLVSRMEGLSIGDNIRIACEDSRRALQATLLDYDCGTCSPLHMNIVVCNPIEIDFDYVR